MRARATSYLILLILFSYPAALFAQAGASSGYHKVQEIALGGDGGWDYLTLDTSAHRLYISRSTQVLVVDPDSGKSLGTIADTPGIHGIALVPEFETGFTSNGRDGTVTAFDLRTLR